MQMRPLGSPDLLIAPLVLGGNVFGWTADEPTSFAILDEFLAAGLNCIDTADVYSRWIPGHVGGESEAILGQWFKARNNRRQVILATKVASEMGPDKKGLSQAYILRAVEASLRRLQTDYIDLYQSHRDDPATPLEETLAAYDILLQQGKVRVIGASNFTAERLTASLDAAAQKSLPPYRCLQPNYNLYDRSDYETNLEPVCLQHRLAVIPYFGLARGFLTGKYRSAQDLGKSPRGGGIKPYLNDRGLRILDALDTVAEQYQSTPASVALAWLIARPSITAPIASATSAAQLRALVAATELKLEPAAIDLLTQASA